MGPTTATPVSPVEASSDGRRGRNVERLRTYFDLLERGELDAWSQLWQEDAVQLIPYATGELPTRIEGRESIHGLYETIKEGFRSLRIDDLRLDPLADPDGVLARWSPCGETSTGAVYRNENIGLFWFDRDTGLITDYVEYFNPVGFDLSADS